VASNVLRIQSDVVWLLAFAAASARSQSSQLNRTRAMLPIAKAFADHGPAGFLGFGCFGLSEVSYYCGPNCGSQLTDFPNRCTVTTAQRPGHSDAFARVREYAPAFQAEYRGCRALLREGIASSQALVMGACSTTDGMVHFTTGTTTPKFNIAHIGLRARCAGPSD
jgi:hypothetical protein